MNSEETHNHINNIMEEITLEITVNVTEEYDRFVFSIISKWLSREQLFIVSKELIIEALRYFKENEPEKYKFLSTKVLDRN